MSILNEKKKNTSVKVTEKLSKYKDLEIDIERMQGMKGTTIPVVTGDLGLTQVTSKYMKYRRSHVLGTSQILRNVLFIKLTSTFNPRP